MAKARIQTDVFSHLFKKVPVSGSYAGLLQKSLTCQYNCQKSQSLKKYSLCIILKKFLAALGLRCCLRAFSSCSEQGLLFVVVRRLLTAVASLVAEHGLQAHGLQQLQHTGFSSCGLRALEHRLSSCGTRAQLLRGVWDLPGPGHESVSPALAGGFLTTVPPGKSLSA